MQHRYLKVPLEVLEVQLRTPDLEGARWQAGSKSTFTLRGSGRDDLRTTGPRECMGPGRCHPVSCLSKRADKFRVPFEARMSGRGAPH